MRDEKKLNFYNETVDELYKRLETRESGLTEEEVKKRLEKYGENKLAEQKKKSNIALFFGQFADGCTLNCNERFGRANAGFQNQNFFLNPDNLTMDTADGCNFITHTQTCNHFL